MTVFQPFEGRGWPGGDGKDLGQVSCSWTFVGICWTGEQLSTPTPGAQMTNTTADLTMFDQPVAATYRAEDGTTEQVAMIGSDLTRRTYPTNMVLIVRPDGTRQLTSEAWLSEAIPFTEPDAASETCPECGGRFEVDANGMFVSHRMAFDNEPCGDDADDISTVIAETLIEIVALLGVDALGWIRAELEQQLPVVHVTVWWQRPLGRLGIKTMALCGARIVAGDVAGPTQQCRECQRALDGAR